MYNYSLGDAREEPYYIYCNKYPLNSLFYGAMQIILNLHIFMASRHIQVECIYTCQIQN